MKTEGTSKLSRRHFLRVMAGTAGALAVAACAQPTPVPPAKPTAAAAPQATAPVVATQPPAKVKTKITWWRSLGGATGATIDGMVQDFNSSQDETEVVAEFQGEYEPLADKFLAAIAARSTPDMVMLSDVGHQTFSRKGVLEQLDPLFAGTRKIDVSEYYGVAKRGIVNGKYYQLPFGVSTPVMYYNADAVKAAGLSGPPQTWDDMFNVYLPKLTVPGKMAGLSYGHLNFWWQQSFIWGYGGKVSDPQYNVYVDTPEMHDFVGRAQKALKTGQAHIATAAEGSIIGYFGSNKAAIAFDSTGAIARVDTVVEKRFDAQVAFIPGGPAGRKVATGGNGLSILAGLPADKRAAAWHFIWWIQQPKQIAFFDSKTGYLPFSKSMAAFIAADLEKDPRRKVAVEQLTYSQPESEIYEVKRAFDTFRDTFANLVESQGDAKVVLPKLQKDLETIIKEEGLKK